MLRQAEHLPGREAPADGVVQEEVVELIGAHQVLCPLADLPLNGGEQLRGDGGVQDVVQHGGQLGVLTALVVGDEGDRWRTRVLGMPALTAYMDI